ncbi:PDDEXK family nuclease [Terriglobus tenax]|uniref:hypothetical protein n=1 Tax=Terriglobus tenax TaxID=1111115 RepID=UPI0021DF745E|nr:hypothetical protein [Terriglobus tenax]
MPPQRASFAEQADPEQTARRIRAFLETHPEAAVLEHGSVLFDLRVSQWNVRAEHGRCTLHLWNDERNLTRRVLAMEERASGLRLSVQRFGQTKPQTLDLMGKQDRRVPTTRDAGRTQYLRTLERVLQREFPDWKPVGFRTAMDLEKSFGPAYARGVLTHGQQALAVIGVGPEESSATIDGILTLGILWLQHCREHAAGKHLFAGLRIVVPRGMAVLTLARMAWLNPRIAQWELYELDPRSEDLEQREPADHGNLKTRLLHAANEEAARERFATAIAQVMELVPEEGHPLVEQRLRSTTEMAFLLHGLEFARAEMNVSANSFAHDVQISFGAGVNETRLDTTNRETLRTMTAGLFARRKPVGDSNDPVYRMQPERWMESRLRTQLPLVDEALLPAPVYAQVPAFAATDRGMLDLLGVTKDGRLAVLELKADEDLHLALQALDYWIRVRWHATPQVHETVNPLQRHGYFTGMVLSRLDPLLYLVAPALRIHPATEVVLRHLKPEVEWQLVALDEHWRSHIKTVFRKRSTQKKQEH